jgi:hypothetical protein
VGLVTDDELGEPLDGVALLPCEPALDGTIAVVVTIVLAVSGCVPDVGELLLELLGSPVKLIEGARGEDVGPPPELVGEIPVKLIGTVVVVAGALLDVDPPPESVGEIPAKLNGTVVVDAGELLTVVGILTTLFEIGAVLNGVTLPPVKDVAPLVVLAAGDTVDAAGEIGVVLTVLRATCVGLVVVGMLMPALASVEATCV